MTLTFHPQECVRLVETETNREEFGVIISDVEVTEEDGSVMVLLYPEFKQDIHDDGLRDVPLTEVRKQYDL